MIGSLGVGNFLTSRQDCTLAVAWPHDLEQLKFLCDLRLYSCNTTHGREDPSASFGRSSGSQIAADPTGGPKRSQQVSQSLTLLTPPPKPKTERLQGNTCQKTPDKMKYMRLSHGCTSFENVYVVVVEIRPYATGTFGGIHVLLDSPKPTIFSVKR